MVKNLPAVQKTQVQSLGQEDPFKKLMATDSNILAWRIPVGRRAWWAACNPWTHTESNTTEAAKQLQQHGLSQDTRSSSLCSIAGPCCSSILYQFASANPKRPLLPSPTLLPLGNRRYILYVPDFISVVRDFTF